MAAGGGIGGFLWQIPNLTNQAYIWGVGNRKVGVEPPICRFCGAIMVLRAKHVQHARLSRTAHEDLTLLLRCPRCESMGAMLDGGDAERALRSGLTYVNLKKGRRIKRKAAEAADAVERAGGPQELIASATRHEIAVSSLKGAQGLALEMAVDEQAEVRDLEREWHRAEEIAEISDNLLTPPAIDEELKRLKDRGQPDG